MSIRRLLIPAAVVLCAGAVASAQGLKVGDKAPPLTVDEWLKGDRVSQFEPGKAYVVEFWATWCGPCISGIPHLSELARKHRDEGVTVISVAAYERGGRDRLDQFMKGDKAKEMDYIVAYDADGTMDKDWMTAAGQQGIPAAFIVDPDGKIAWIGHPMRMDEAIATVAKAAKGGVARDGRKDQEKAKQGEPGTLAVGDKAPALHVAEWVKGAPVTTFEKGNVYVVEFWATWCGPCIASMPHLSELQKEYRGKNVTIIGLTSADPNNTLDGVKQMVEDKGDVMAYTVAWDEGRKTNEAYMKAADQRGIPTSFVVDRDGRVAWIGHPMNLDEPLAQIVAGEYDIRAAADSFRRKKEAEKKAEPIHQRFRQAYGAGDWEGAAAAVDDLIALDPEVYATMKPTKFMLLLKKREYENAYALGREIVNGPQGKNPGTLNMIAWTIVDPDEPVERKDLDLALQAAERAAELTQHGDAAILDTLALVHFLKGNVGKAVEIQTRAVDLAEGPMRPELEARLAEFKEAQGGAR